MKLKSIDIQGFKSFPDRTILDFDKGVTAVIGPNGSGKSNIADAMLWVMGEQSVKSLRGSKMEDVIFDGTKVRKAQGYASVTICIDNSDRSLGYASDEVAVQRRLYRSGDSEYRINGTAVRLKDVNELFMDTGLGKDGYSIIGQGKVSEIVSAKSEDRREIFEEAAGISKYRSRKTEAERKLSSAEDNLVRLRDILTELESQLGPLKVQSEKAREYIDYASEKKDLEISLWVRSLNQIKHKLAEEEDKLILAQNEYKESNSKVESLRNEFNAEVERSNMLLADMERYRVDIDILNQNANAMNTTEAVNKNKIENNEKTISELEQAIASDDSSLSGVKAHKDELLEELDKLTLKRDSHEEKITNLANDISNKTNELGVLIKEEEELKLRRSAAYSAIDSAKLEASASSAVLGTNKARLGEATSALTKCQENQKQLLKEKADAEELCSNINEQLAGFDNVANAFNLKLTNRQQKLDVLVAKQRQLSEDIAKGQNKAKLLSDLDKSMDGFNAGVKIVLSRSKAGVLSDIVGTVSSVISTKGEYSLAIETALGGHMQDIITLTDVAAKKAINLLKNEKAGRATFLPINTISPSNPLETSKLSNQPGFVGIALDLISVDLKYKAVLSTLLGKIAIVKDLDYASVIAKNNNYSFRIVTLDGQVINAGGSMSGGYQIKGAGLIGRHNEIIELNEKVKELSEELEGLNDEIKEITDDIAIINSQKLDKESEKQTLIEDQIRAETALSSIEKNLTFANEQLEIANKEISELNASIEELSGKSQGSSELSDKLTSQLDELAKKINENNEKQNGLNSSITSLQNVLNEQNTNLSFVQKDIEVANTQIASIEETLSSHAEKQSTSKSRIEELVSEDLELKREIDVLHKQREQSQNQIEELNSLIEKKNIEHSLSQQKQAELRAKETTETTLNATLAANVAKLGEKNESAQAEQKAIIDKLFEEYELTRTDAEEIAKPVEDVNKSNRRLSELKNKIKALGPVNVEAIEQYKEVYERHYDFSRRLSDIEQSKNELQKLILDLTVKMSEIFKEKFEQINEHFKRIFVELFEGGSANLTLADPTNILESSIEITVHPPGKIIKNLSALSGGEQSFVAICIFFAILKVNPSPFCLMDEVDSALDENNVDKFAQYLHGMTEKTQFITITHRRGTMEAADVLYGVTMQEEGVSKLLKLNVSEIEATMHTKVNKG